MKNKFNFLHIFALLLFSAIAQAQTSPAVTLQFLESSEVLDSCTGCTNPYQSHLFTGVKVTVGNRVTYVDAPYSIRRYGTSRLKFELKSAVSGNSVRFAYGQVNSTTYPTVTRLYDDLRIQRFSEPGLYTNVTATGTVTLTNAHQINLINSGGTQASQTFNLPATPVDGQVCRLVFNNIVTTLTISGNGTTLSGTAATTAAVGTALVYRYYATATKWIREL